MSGNSNRFVIEETDLSLEGKNGLNVEIIRRHDNQLFDWSFRSVKTTGDGKMDISIGKFRRSDNHKEIYVGFLSEDDYYTYMYDGMMVKEMTRVRETEDGIEFYLFNELYKKRTDTGIYLYDVSYGIERETQYNYPAINSLSEFYNSLRSYSIGEDWELLLPEASLFRYDKYVDGDFKSYEAIGVFRGMDGVVYGFNGTQSFTENEDGSYKYTSTLRFDDNKYLSISKSYASKTLENGLKYNCVITDNRGITYYFYHTDYEDNVIGTRENLKIVAVRDNYNNTIYYTYDNSYENLSKIIDTYGREITFTYVDNSTEISYFDTEAQTYRKIKYENEDLSASSLDNDSPIKQKNIKRFKVTNQNGETTIYDSRETENLSYVNYSIPAIDSVPENMYGIETKTNKGTNIERIIYPNGLESRYRYKYIYLGNKDTAVTRGVYGLEDSYDIADGKIFNHKTYEFEKDAKDEITITEYNEALNNTTVNRYNKKGQLVSTVTSEDGSTSDESISVSNTYDSSTNSLKKRTEKTNRVETETKYEFEAGYPNLLKSTVYGERKIDYTYHKRNKEYTDIPASVKYSYEDKKDYYDPTNITYTADFTKTTELTPDGKSVQSETVTQKNVVKSKSKYDYDTSGRLTAATQWTNDTNADGVFNENDSFIKSESSYALTENNTLKYTDFVSDVVNVDGENEGTSQRVCEYNIHGSPVTLTDAYGAETNIEYDALNRPVKYTYDNGAVKTIEYNNIQMYTIVTDEAGIKTKNSYDVFGNIIEKSRLIDNVWTVLEKYEYDLGGRVTSKTVYNDNNVGIREEYSYNPISQITEKKVYELPSKLLYTEQYEYNGGEITKTTIAADKTKTAEETNYYDKFGQLIKTKLTDGSTTLTSTAEYDYLGRKTKETDPAGNVTSYEYTYDGNVSKKTDAAGNVMTTEYDLAGNPVAVTDANGNTSLTEYDKMGRVIKTMTPFENSSYSITKTYYDKNSNVIKQAEANNSSLWQTKEYQYDSMGNVIADIAVGYNNDSNIVTQYNYDTAGRISEMVKGLNGYSEDTSGGAVTHYTYNNQGYLSVMTDPMGYAEYYNDYDYNGNLLKRTDKNGSVFNYKYGPYGLLETSVANSEEGKEYKYNNIGRLTEASAITADGEHITEQYTYDAFGRLTQKTDDNEKTHTYTYDNNSNVLEYKLKDGSSVKNAVEYTYDSINRLTAMENNDIITSYTYDANGNLTKKETDEGLTTEYGYNKAGFITSMKNMKGSTVNDSYTCRYYQNGLKIDETAVHAAFGDEEQTEMYKLYGYNSVGMLRYEMFMQDQDIVYDSTYYYDARGNRTSSYIQQQSKSGKQVNYTYDLNDRLSGSTFTENLYADGTYTSSEKITGGTKYRYDNNGNLVSEDVYKRQVSGSVT